MLKYKLWSVAFYWVDRLNVLFSASAQFHSKVYCGWRHNDQKSVFFFSSSERSTVGEDIMKSVFLFFSSSERSTMDGDTMKSVFLFRCTNWAYIARTLLSVRYAAEQWGSLLKAGWIKQRMWKSLSSLLHSEAVTESLVECLDPACTLHSPPSFLPSLSSFLFSKTSN